MINKILLLILLPVVAQATGVEGGGLGARFIRQASFNQNLPGVDVQDFNEQIKVAAKELSHGDLNLEKDILDSYNPNFATRLLENRPELSILQAEEKMKAVAKFSSGVSILDQYRIVDGETAVDAISNQDDLLKNHTTIDLDDLIQATKENNQWSF